MKNFTEDDFQSTSYETSYEKVELEDLISPLAELQEEHLHLQDDSYVTDPFHTTPYYSGVSLEMLDQFKQLLIAFKYRQDEEKATAQDRILLARELKLAHAKIKELTKDQNDSHLKDSLTDFYDTLILKELSEDDKQQEVHSLLSRLQTELQMSKEEILSLQQQIQITKSIAANLENEIDAARKQQKDAVPFDNHENDLYEQSLTESRLHAEQLERAIHILRGKSEESNLEKAQLLRELQAYQNANDILNKQIEDSKATEDSLKQQLDQEKSDKDAAIAKALSFEQKSEMLKDHILKLQQSYEHQETGMSEALKSHQDLYEEREQLTTALNEKNNAFNALVSEVTIIKQSLISGLREAKELESQYLAAVKEKVDAVSQFSQLQRATDKQRLEIERTKTQCKELMAAAQCEREEFNRQFFDQQNAFNELKIVLSNNENENQQLKTQIEGLNTKILTALAEINESQKARQRIEDELHKCEKFAQEKEIMSNELLDRLLRVEEEKNNAYEDLDMCHRALEEKEQLFDEAQQHLAKKVREVTQLDSTIEELNAQAKASLSSYETIENHNNELKARLQKGLDLQVHLEEKINAHLRDIDHWKEKHSDIEIKWHAATIQIADLQKISERHQQLQNMVSNFGNILGMPIEPAAALPTKTENEFAPAESTPFKSVSQEAIASKHEDSPGLFQNLFDAKKSQNPKNDFFD